MSSTKTPRRLVIRAGTAVAAAALLCTAGLTHAQDIREHPFRFGFSLAKDHPLGVGAQKFADLVAAKSAGKMKVQLFPAAALGSDPQNLAAVRAGTLDMTSMATGLLAGIDKGFMIFDFPFLFDNAQEAFKLADGPVGAKLMEKLQSGGLVGLGIWDLGFRNITNSQRPIAKAEDLQGLKLRVIASPVYIDLFSTLGASPVPMTFGEVYAALQSKAIDGQDNPVGVIESAKFAEVQKYLSLTRHVYTGMPVLFSKKVWEGLSSPERKVIQDATAEATDEQRKVSLAREAQSVAALRKAMQVNELPAAEVAKLREKVKPLVDRFSAEVGKSRVDEVHAELAKMRSSK